MQESGADPIGFSWEEQYQRSWDTIQEDETGSIRTSILQTIRRRRFPTVPTVVADGIVKRGLVRHLFLILDCSRSALEETDFFPNRLAAFIGNLDRWFLEQFFDANCLGMVGVILLKNGVAEIACDLTGNFHQIRESLRSILPSLVRESVASSENVPSLLNGVSLAVKALEMFGKTGSSSEILICYSAIFSIDPSDISIASFSNVKISAICVSGELNLLRLLTHNSGGTFLVPVAEGMLKETLQQFLPPPATSNAATTAELQRIAFPKREDAMERQIFCFCHVQRIEKNAFVCPNCQCVVCSIPMECPVCCVLLISGVHLARSFCGLFPIGEFVQAANAAGKCFGCNQTEFSSDAVAFHCPECKKLFCPDCDAFLHGTLQICPGCK